MSTTKTATCMLCEAVCGLELKVDGDRLLRVVGDARDPFSRGHICPKAAAIDDVRIDPDRVTYPMRRTRGGGFSRVSWRDALGEATDRLSKIREAHGRHAIATYVGNPLAHSYGALLGSITLRQALGTRNNFSATSADQLPHMLASLEVLGHQLLLPVPDIDRTQFMLIVGANPVVSNGSIMTAPGVKKRLEAVRARGGKVIVIDPRRTETAAIADEHHFIQPGTDALFLLAVLYTIFAEGLARPGRLAPLVDGLGALEAAAADFSPESVAPVTGIAADVTRRLARELAAAGGAACYSRMGACTQEFGGLTAWLTLAIDVVTGNLDRAGGNMFPTPAADLIGLASALGRRGSFARYRSRVRGLPEFGGELPVAALAEEIEAPGDGQIRALITMAGNPALSSPNGPAVERALASLEFMVSVDVYINETTRHANLILPPSFGLERDHYDLVFYALSVRNAARYAPAIFAKRGEARDDFDIATELAARLASRAARGLRGWATFASVRAVQALGARRMLDGLLRAGPHKLSLAKLRASPHGEDLGPLEPRLPKLLGADRRIQIAPRLFLGDLPRLKQRLLAPPLAPGALVLIGRRHLRSNNSWLHNSARLVKGRAACVLLMHPEDARARGIASGGAVNVRSRTGVVTVVAEVSDEMGRGVVSLPHGWGHHRQGAQQSVASSRAGVSVNDLTDEQFIDALTGNAGFSGVTVEVAPAPAP